MYVTIAVSVGTTIITIGILIKLFLIVYSKNNTFDNTIEERDLQRVDSIVDDSIVDYCFQTISKSDRTTVGRLIYLEDRLTKVENKFIKRICRLSLYRERRKYTAIIEELRFCGILYVQLTKKQFDQLIEYGVRPNIADGCKYYIVDIERLPCDHPVPDYKHHMLGQTNDGHEPCLSVLTISKCSLDAIYRIQKKYLENQLAE